MLERRAPRILDEEFADPAKALVRGHWIGIQFKSRRMVSGTALLKRAEPPFKFGWMTVQEYSKATS
jgi:hypothetical protein